MRVYVCVCIMYIHLQDVQEYIFVLKHTSIHSNSLCYVHRQLPKQVSAAEIHNNILCVCL